MSQVTASSAANNTSRPRTQPWRRRRRVMPGSRDRRKRGRPAAGLPLQAISGAHQGFLIGPFERQDVDHAAAEDYESAVADQPDFLQFGGVEEHRGTLRGELAEERVDLLLRPNVDPAGRVEAKHGVCPGGDPAGNGDLLLVTAREPLDFALGARVDLQPSDGVVDADLFLARVERAPGARARAEGEGDVFAHRALHQERLRAVAGDIDEPGTDGVGGMTEPDLPPVHRHRPAGGPDRAREDAEQLVLALAFECDDAEYLGGAQIERHVRELCADREVSHAEAR